MPDLNETRAVPGDTVQTRDQESHGTSSDHSRRRTEEGDVRTQRGRKEELPPDLRDRGHEPSDIRVRGVAFAILGLMAGIAVSAAFVWGVLWYERSHERRPQVTAVLKTNLRPPEPRLQTNPVPDRIAIESAARERLLSYAWSDEPGRARIPISRSMALLAEHGWPDPDETVAVSLDRPGERPWTGPDAADERTRQPLIPREQSYPGGPPFRAPP
jgi:hypothetical protein